MTFASHDLFLLRCSYGDTKGYYAWRPIGKFAIPSTESITYVLAPLGTASDDETSSVTITVNWLGLYQDSTVGVAVRELQAALKVAEKAEKSKKYHARLDESQLRLSVHDMFESKITEETIAMSNLKGFQRHQSTATKTEVLRGVPVAHSSGVAYVDYSQDVGILKVHL